jgi:glycosyltransferase involved in cell wall biosynthesis
VRIALVVAGGVDRSGRERVTPALLWLIERLAARHQVVVYVLRYHDRPCTYPLCGATIRDLGSPNGLPRQYSRLVAAMRRDGPFDVVHGYQALPSGLCAALAGVRLRVPSLVTFDSGEFVALPEVGDDSDDCPRGYGLQIRARHRVAVAATARLAARVTVCTEYQERLARAHGVAAEVVAIGVDVRLFPSRERSEGPPWRLLQVASLNPVKDQTTLLHAFQRLLSRPLDVHLDLVGEDTMRGAMAAVARELNLTARVTFHGVQPSDALPVLYQRAHLFVLSSRHEAANVVVLEAAASGLATVGTNVGYLADWSPDRAIVVNPGDPSALADAVAGLIADAPARRRLAAAAREWTLAHDADWTARRFEQLYASLAAREVTEGTEGTV